MSTTHPDTHMPLLEYRNITKCYDRHCVLRDINLTIPTGRIVGLLGKNGTGKSTLIKLVNDLLTPTSGEVLFLGHPIGVDSKRQISYLPERTYLDKSMTIAQTLKYFQIFYADFDRTKADADELRTREGKSVDEIFRQYFKAHSQHN